MTILDVFFDELPSYRGDLQCGQDVKVLTKDFCFSIIVESRGVLVTFACRIAGGYTFDGASIPRALWWLFGHPFESPRDAAALIHDWLYETKIFTRAEADNIYRVALCTSHAPRHRSRLEWLALRLFGFAAWHACTAWDKRIARGNGEIMVDMREMSIDGDVTARDLLDDYIEMTEAAEDADGVTIYV